MGVTSEERIWSPILDQLVSVTKHWGTYCSLSDRFSFCCFIATHQPEHEKMHFSENCHYLFLSIIISPLRIYYGQERFLDGAGWTWKAWDFYFFFSISEGPDAASEKLYLTQWAGKPCENSSLGPVLKHKSFCSWLQMKPWHGASDSKQK